MKKRYYRLKGKDKPFQSTNLAEPHLRETYKDDLIKLKWYSAPYRRDLWNATKLKIKRFYYKTPKWVVLLAGYLGGMFNDEIKKGIVGLAHLIKNLLTK